MYLVVATVTKVGNVTTYTGVNTGNKASQLGSGHSYVITGMLNLNSGSATVIETFAPLTGSITVGSLGIVSSFGGNGVDLNGPSNNASPILTNSGSILASQGSAVVVRNSSNCTLLNQSTGKIVGDVSIDIENSSSGIHLDLSGQVGNKSGTVIRNRIQNTTIVARGGSSIIGIIDGGSSTANMVRQLKLEGTAGAFG